MANNKSNHPIEWNLEALANAMTHLARTMDKIHEDLAMLKEIRDALNASSTFEEVTVTPYPFPGATWVSPQSPTIQPPMIYGTGGTQMVAGGLANDTKTFPPKVTS